MHRTIITCFLIFLAYFTVSPNKTLCQSNVFKNVEIDEIALNLLKTDYEKSKYETNKKYIKRLSKNFPYKKISVRIDEYEDFIKTTYDADKKLYEIIFKSSKFKDYSSNNKNKIVKEKLSINFKTKINKVKSYIGENSFGAKREITYSQIDKFFLVVDNTYDLKIKLNMEDTFGDLKNGKFPINLSPKEAQSLDENFYLIINCSILNDDYVNTPFLLNGSKTIAPTIDKPFAFSIKSYGVLVKVDQLHIVNKKTNKVYLSIDTSKWP